MTFWEGPKERLALLASAEITRPEGAPPWRLQIALDAEHVAEWLAEYRERLYWMVGGGTLGTALLGWLITRRGLQPLRQITATVKGFTAQAMGARLDARAVAGGGGGAGGGI